MRFGDLRDLLGRPNADDFTAVVTRFRPKVDNPVGTLDDFEIVLDHDDRVAAIDQALKNLKQHRDVIEMQTGRRFVEDEQATAFVCGGSRPGRPV